MIQAAKEGEKNPKNYSMLASFYVTQGRFKEAIECLVKGLEKVIPNFELYGLRGSSYANLGLYEDAYRSFGKAEELAPDSPRV